MAKRLPPLPTFFTQEEIDAAPNEYAKKRMMYSNKARDNIERQRARQQNSEWAPKPEPEPSNMGSLLKQHHEMIERMDAKNIPKHRRSYRIPAALIVQLLQAGLTIKDAAAVLKIGAQALTRKIQKYGLDPKGLRAYAKHKTDVITAIEQKLLHAVGDDSKIDRATLRDCATSFKMLHEANRQEKGLQDGPTVNITVANATLADLEEKEKKLLKQLEELSGGKIGTRISDAEIVDTKPEDDLDFLS